MSRDDIRKKFYFAGYNRKQDSDLDEIDFTEKPVRNDWTEEEVAEALHRILEREWDRFKFLGWL